MNNKIKWISRYSPQKEVAFRQWAAEVLCERKANSLDKDLPVRFWIIAEWKGYFFFCLKQLDKLLKIYTEHEIFTALKQNKTTYSVRNPVFLKDLAKIHNMGIEHPQEVEIRLIEQSEVNTFIRRSQHQHSILDKLKDLE